MDDQISRKEAIDYCYQLINVEYEQGSDEMNYGQERVNQTETILHHLEIMPPAQPETHEKRTETHACDLISRKAAVDAHYEYCNKHPDAGFPVWSLKILEHLPSAQPEVLACGEGELIAQPEILQDGTVMIDVPDLDTVNRVIASSGKWCKVFYMDDSERRTDERSVP